MTLPRVQRILDLREFRDLLSDRDRSVMRDVLLWLIEDKLAEAEASLALTDEDRTELE